MDTAYFAALIEAGRTAQTLLAELLLNVERAYLRGESLSIDWMIRQLSEIESELAPVA